MGWWFGRSLTFELVADETSPTVGFLISDASGKAISSDDGQQVIGYAAYGSSMRNAVEPLVTNFGVELFDDGTVLRAATTSAPVNIGDELGNSADNNVAPRVEREQASVRSVPSALRLTYYDPQRDYQTGEGRAVATEDSGAESQEQLAVVLGADDAKSLAQQVLGRTWAQRDKLTLRLPPSRLPLEPGETLELALNPASWIISKTTIDGFVVVAELFPAAAASVAMSGDGGRIVPSQDVVAGSVTVALLDLPNIGSSSNVPTVLLAASTATPGWRKGAVSITFGGQNLVAETAATKAVLGTAASALAAANTDLIDGQSAVEIVLLDTDQWLASCDDDALASGANLAALGREIIQFGSVISLGSGRFQLSRLLRGRAGTEWACGSHAAGEAFCLLQPLTIQAIELPAWSIGAEIAATIGGGTGATITFGAEGLRPPSPVNLIGELQPGGDLVLTWIRRSRQGFAWVDGVDAPLGETAEQYRVMITGAAGVIELTTNQPSLTVAGGELAAIGTGVVTIQVVQTGDFAASHPTQISFSLS